MAEWIKTSEKLPNDNKLVLAKWGKQVVAVRFLQGISKETRSKMESGEIENPDIEQTCPCCGVTTVKKRSELVYICDEGAENRYAALSPVNEVPYCWKSRKYHRAINGQEITEWMPLVEPYRSALL